MSTRIEWTDETWNPTTGCDRVSPGCDNCYALTMAARLKGMGQPKYQRDGDSRTSGPGFGLTQHPDVLDQPLRWRKPRRVFVNSISDLFHPRVTDEFIARVWAVMYLADAHTFQVLTKRPKRMRALLASGRFLELVTDEIRAHDPDPERQEQVARDPSLRRHYRPGAWPLPNVWLGTSVEDQQRADERIPALLDTPAAVRFLSCEPLLGPVDLSRWAGPTVRYGVERLHWVIVGGESGDGARPMAIAWARDVVDQCASAGVPVFVKQLGAQPTNGGRPVDLRHAKGADPGEWPWFLRRQQFPDREGVPA